MLDCGHHFYSVLRMCAHILGENNVEILCAPCGRWVKIREIHEGQKRLEWQRLDPVKE